MSGLRTFWGFVGAIGLIVGVLMSRFSTVDQEISLGHFLIIAGAILTVGVLVSTAIVATVDKEHK